MNTSISARPKASGYFWPFREAWEADFSVSFGEIGLSNSYNQGLKTSGRD